MDSCGPLLANHFLLEKQVEPRPPLHSITSSARASSFGGTSSSFAVLTLFGRRYIHQGFIRGSVAPIKFFVRTGYRIFVPDTQQTLSDVAGTTFLR